ncbi:hypothetical protein CcaverHIS002_0310860 [Cutaneotrichosporon cavernicola]|uniref:Elongation factor methyltransferase 7 n=1 Tax=Cutaneotrichosporon cavernicola TaxID=279322 RepID=A0AA48L2Z1_9TREE|nr:uncharacterized protein CcaverHIS019_0310720 [Cutaneotrichosporon cavernicola]BEI83218.1 hypothetical protein CcaverHIS002_0310860 [Cutaneotrichosporon cavernicola]BEI91002.1 hypothetical protein CcaverHIS019_0310720 [Cutaneotrichosporon cavernicola]BEI98781.1 hypothetical protein CcaverHIS631_0310800 [Cutaneotrichosporon cavernicola]BEJ06552.1 hypothetical protein CcaverHIS641_0310740 [Cutaneotrichosporon cavernicola]
MSTSGDDDLGLCDLMPRSPSPEPIPFSFATYTLPSGFALPSGETDISIRLVGTHPLWGHHLWNTARVTTNYILAHPELTKGKRVLELGAGGALPSLAAALGGATFVAATDYNDAALLENIAFNVASNLDHQLGDRVEAIGHTWGADVAPLLEGGKYDLVILSDLAFNHSQHPALMKTLDATLADDGIALVFLTHHRPRFAEADMAFFPNLAKKGYGYERVVEEYTGAMFQDDPGDERVRGTVHGFRCWRDESAKVDEEEE